ncbi:putative PLAC8 motif-containing protein [Rosa chinensis]|uniref:Putative PLAC8 motif-containing protein n=1 Tax=Rosa chinensis TaxID=74649 RepID=A0A2P6QCG1_ROSCH|nr:putative PLAC8 motif-containing protein [Rosa chinensis]
MYRCSVAFVYLGGIWTDLGSGTCIFNLVAVNIDNETIREALAITSIILCVFGLLYGGFWRIQMRKRFNLPSYNFCFGEPAVSDCTLWLFYCCSPLAQEMRTGNTYNIVEDQFCRKETDIPSQPRMSPLPREDGVGQLRSGPSSPLGNYSSQTKTGIIGSPSPSRF